jgi:hypothetical protein
MTGSTRITAAAAWTTGPLRRWPSALALAHVIPALFVIIGERDTDFAAGIAAMACIYLAAYVVGRQAAAWPAYLVVIAVLLAAETSDLDSRTVMTALLFLLWVLTVVRGGFQDGRWFGLQTSGMVVFGGLTLLAIPLDARAAGVVAGIGFFSHGLWDAYHFVKNRVVNRPWSEMCAVIDLIVGPVLIVVALIK